MSIAVVAGKLQFSDDSSGLRIADIYNARHGPWALIGTSDYKLAGSLTTLQVLKTANPSYRITAIQQLLLELLSSSDLTTQRLGDSIPGHAGGSQRVNSQRLANIPDYLR